ncbi:hypothetical protein ACFC26_43905 [Kitasatospora purpeofusca]|uniref:hypothetical protein n=1 Tax=Kitasatospora purpeofusca TaxID=67352 RepID=UPI0035D947AE
MTDDQKAATPTKKTAGTKSGVDLADEVHYPPVENGLDYMVSVVEHLRGEKVNRRNLKYAVVHLQAAVECLLKYRLETEHWSLVFKQPGEATRSALDDGSLNSCTVDQTITRLNNIVGASISEGEKTKLKQLAQLRNQLQHYGRPHDTKVNRYVIEANAAQVLEFLVHFVDKEVLPNIAPPDGEIAENLRLIREGLDEIRGYVTARMQRLRPELDLVKLHTVQCLSCDQLALVVGDEGEAHCLYCHHQLKPETAALSYAENVLGRGWWAARDGDHREPVEWCPICDVHALVRGSVTADNPDAPVDLCFNCGECFEVLEECARCGTPFDPTDGEVSCDDCLYDMINDGR